MKILTTRGIGEALESIIRNAKEELVLVSPFVQFEPKILSRLKATSERGVKIIMLVREKDLKAEQLEHIKGIPTCHLYYHDNLHAKVYYNESEAVITSMNLYDYSEKNNLELGAYISKKDKKQFHQLKDEVHFFLEESKKEVIQKVKKYLINNEPFVIEDFPKKNLTLYSNFNGKHGLVYYGIERKVYDGNVLEKRIGHIFKRELEPEFRVYWSQTKISLYANTEHFVKGDENTEYYLKAIQTFNRLIDEYFVESTPYYLRMIKNVSSLKNTSSN